MKRLLLILVVFVLIACSGGKGKLDDARLTLPNESANSKIFGAWIFKVKPEGTDCKNVDLSKLGETFYEESTILKTKEGCHLKEMIGNEGLTVNEAIYFENGGVKCEVGGNVINLTQEGDFSKFMDKDCTLKAKETLGLELNEKDKLVGTYLVSFDVSGKCPEEMQNCQVRAGVEGTRGNRASSDPANDASMRGKTRTYVDSYDHCEKEGGCKSEYDVETEEDRQRYSVPIYPNGSGSTLY